MSTALAYERVFVVGDLRHLFDQLVEYVRENGLGQKQRVRQKVAELTMRMEIGELLAWRVVWLLSQGKVPVYEASMAKFWCTEFEESIVNVGIELLGQFSQLTKANSRTYFGEIINMAWADAIRKKITAGASEIQRNIVALRGLNMRA